MYVIFFVARGCASPIKRFTQRLVTFISNLFAPGFNARGIFINSNDIVNADRLHKMASILSKVSKAILKIKTEPIKQQLPKVHPGVDIQRFVQNSNGKPKLSLVFYSTPFVEGK